MLNEGKARLEKSSNGHYACAKVNVYRTHVFVHSLSLVLEAEIERKDDIFGQK